LDARKVSAESVADYRSICTWDEKTDWCVVIGAMGLCGSPSLTLPDNRLNIASSADGFTSMPRLSWSLTTRNTDASLSLLHKTHMDGKRATGTRRCLSHKTRGMSQEPGAQTRHAAVMAPTDAMQKKHREGLMTTMAVVASSSGGHFHVVWTKADSATRACWASRRGTSSGRERQSTELVGGFS
jgi:hypothetical protein